MMTPVELQWHAEIMICRHFIREKVVVLRPTRSFGEISRIRWTDGGKRVLLLKNYLKE